MAKDLDAHLRPLITLAHEQVLPIARAQGLPQAIGCLQQQRVFVEHGERVAQGTTRLAHALAGDFLRLQLVQAAFAAAKAQPAQAVEKVMQVVSGGDALLGMDKRLIGLSFGQLTLWHKTQVGATARVRGLVQRIGHAVPCHHRRMHGLAQRRPGLKPRGLPIDGWPGG